MLELKKKKSVEIRLLDLKKGVELRLFDLKKVVELRLLDFKKKERWIKLFGLGKRVYTYVLVLKRLIREVQTDIQITICLSIYISVLSATSSLKKYSVGLNLLNLNKEHWIKLVGAKKKKSVEIRLLDLKKKGVELRLLDLKKVVELRLLDLKKERWIKLFGLGKRVYTYVLVLKRLIREVQTDIQITICLSIYISVLSATSSLLLLLLLLLLLHTS